MTAGQIAAHFRTLVETSKADPDHQRLSVIAQRFGEVVRSRDDLLLARPYTAEGGEQRLSYRGRHGLGDWPIEAILGVAREFEELAIETNDLFHNGGRYERYKAGGGP